MAQRRIALVSDTHGNAVGFDAVLAELGAQSFDEIICLGDVAQGGPQPAECVDRLRELGCRCVFGNSDEFLLTLDPGTAEAGHLDEEQLARLLSVGRWSQEQLGRERLDVLRGFEPTVEVELDGGGHLLCFHGSPSSNEDVVLPDTDRADVQRMIGDHRADVYAGGHVHLQWLRRLGRAVWLCAGSAGMAWEHGVPDDELRFDPWAEYALLSSDGGRLAVEFRRVPFDGERVRRAIRESGMPAREWYVEMWTSR
jgi:predicted phosphodiesterase